MSEASASPVPPKPKDDNDKPNHISVKVKDDRENEVFFKIKYTTPLTKVMSAYCERQGVTENTQRFFIEGRRIVEGDTPASLDMEDGDMIEVHQEQQGGSGSSETPEVDEEVKNLHMSIRVKDQGESEVEFKIKRTTPLGKVMAAYCKTKEMSAGSVRFLHDGQRLVETDTAKSRGLEDGDVIQAFLEQQGGNSESPKPESKHVELRVKDQNENEINFKVKKTTPLGKVMDAYCQRSEKVRTSVRFLFEGARIQDNDTPESLEMESGDMIEVFLEQLGGI